uniref:GATA transcription factor 11 n=1 Tax=Aegilops tauschii TaxID=37682 RepID=M8BS93_AEGTA
MASGRFMEEMMREHEQSLLEATCGGLFDHIEDLLDFPKEDSAEDVLLLDAPVPDSPLAARVLGGGVPPPAPASLEGQQQASLMVPPPPPAGDHSAAFLGALGDTHIGTSFSGSGRPWSVPLSPRPEPPVLVIPARARSKRSRASAFPAAIRAAVPAPEATILVPTPMFSSTSSYSEEPECIAESNSQPKKKKKAKRPTPPVTSDAEGDADYEEGSGTALAPGEVRRCTHCQIDKTPQWRAGPLGPKTLCNACGVRYKSGRLFPEYRPAASPTFVPAIHSNSHKKVVEMRQKVEPKGDDLLQFIRRRD